MRKNTLLLTITLLILTRASFAQTTDSTNNILHLKGAVTVTNKGISFIPSFSLGKPAAMFELSVGKKKFFFEPQFRFALEGKPWSFLFWFRYKIIDRPKFGLTVGGHPALNFRTDSFTVNGTQNGFMVTRRYLAGEIAPNYFVSKNMSVGVYYLYSRGLDNGTTRVTHFFTVNSNLSNISLGNGYSARFTPQVFYLKQDATDGFYVTSTITINKKNCPLAAQAIMNKTIRTDIPGSQSFLWNASLIYAFNKNYARRS